MKKSRDEKIRKKQGEQDVSMISNSQVILPIDIELAGPAVVCIPTTGVSILREGFVTDSTIIYSTSPTNTF